MGKTQRVTAERPLVNRQERWFVKWVLLFPFTILWEGFKFVFRR